MENKNILFLVVLLFISVGCASVKHQENPQVLGVPKKIEGPLTSIYIVDRNGLTETICAKEKLKLYEDVDFLSSQPYQKVLRVFKKDKTALTRSIVTSYYQTGLIKQYLEIENGRARGLYCEWHPNGAKKLISHVISGNPDIDARSQVSWAFEGTNTAWSESGALLAEIPYVKGEMNGKATFRYPTGELLKEVTYVKGEMEGVLCAYFKDGTLQEESSFKRGQQDGPSRGFWPKGAQKWQEEYEGGLLKSGSYYDAKGAVVSKIVDGKGRRCLFDETGVSAFQEYKEGIQEGEVTLLERNRFPICRYSVKNGEKHGQEIRYYLPKSLDEQKEYTPMPKLSIDWVEGKIQGTVKTWYDNGKQESQKEMSNNQKQGIFTSWYRDGSLMLVEEYEKDKLIRGQYLKKGEATPISRIEKGTGIATLFDPDGYFSRKISYRNSSILDDVAQ
jgi:antitoxin component YwqK of YwqJK toxin-antitoxin module